MLAALFRRAVLPAIMIVAAVDGACAQAPAPVGLWQGSYSGDYILVQANGACSARGMVNVGGWCTWQSTSTGGVLTMTYQWTIGPARIGWSIRWLDSNTLFINGKERFIRRG